MPAALAAARSGARVILAEEDFRLGGRLLAERYEIDGAPALDWVKAAEAELESLPECRILRRTTVQGVYDGGTYAAIERVNDHVAVPPAHEPRQRLWKIVAKRAVLCARARSSGQSCSATTTVPASCWPARCALTSIAMAWRRASAR